MVVDPAGLEVVVAGVAPQDRGHPQLVGVLEGLGDFDDLPTRVLAAEVDGGPHGHRAHVPGLLDGSEENLLGSVGVGHQFVVVDLHHERDLVGVLAGHGAQDAKGGGHRVAAALDGQADDVLGIEIHRVLGERGAPGVFDALVHGEDRHVAGVGQTAGAEQLLQAAQDLRCAVGVGHHAIDEVPSGQVEHGLVDGLALMLEQELGFLAQQGFDSGKPGGICGQGHGLFIPSIGSSGCAERVRASRVPPPSARSPPQGCPDGKDSPPAGHPFFPGPGTSKRSTW